MGHWKFKEEKLSIAHSLGYYSIEEAFIKLYKYYQSCNKVAEAMNMTRGATWTALKRLGVELIPLADPRRRQSGRMEEEATQILNNLSSNEWQTPSEVSGYVPSITAKRLDHLYRGGYVEKKQFQQGNRTLNKYRRK